METDSFHFQLPAELIAQHPAPRRDASRLLILRRHDNQVGHGRFRDLLAHLRCGDVLVLNDSRVVPARLWAVNKKAGTRFEILLLEENSVNDWWAMMRPAKRARIGTELSLTNPRGVKTSIAAAVTDTNIEGHRRLEFSGASDIRRCLDELGEVPLPPYIKRERGILSTDDRSRYQTVYARDPGSVAAPTAGLHFTDALLSDIRAQGVEICLITLHVGLGTFAPVKTDRLQQHTMHEERYYVSDDSAKQICAAKSEGRRVIAVGTTSVRVLETIARQNNGRIVAGSGRTNIFIYPPFAFQIVDALVTNFHLPRSTLLMLVSAFAAPTETRGLELVLSAYSEAVRQRYRFFSYGDAMLIL